MPVLKIITLGCKVNQYESEYVREGFAKLGYHEVAASEEGQVPLDLILVNTCTVTAESEAKSRKIIRRLAKQHPEAEIIVLGCYAARAGEEAARLPGVTEVISDKRELPELLKRRGLHENFEGISSFEGQHRAWVKVQDGCRQHCSYCIVPLVRPHLASRSVEEVLAEILRLTRRNAGQVSNLSRNVGQVSNLSTDCWDGSCTPIPGATVQRSPQPERQLPLKSNRQVRNLSYGAAFSEIVLTGIHLGHYGIEQPEPRIDLAGLVEKIVALPGEFRLRFSSIEAAEVTPRLLELMADHPNRICPHLHLPLQSGSDAILEKMKRRWPVGRFLDRCREICAKLDRPALTTDVIVGFPGETEDDFTATCRAVEEAGFSKVHVFRFSPRQGTPAAALPNRVPQRIHQHWATRLNHLSDQLRAKYLLSLIGTRVQVLIEGVNPRTNRLQGIADRYVTVELEGDPATEGSLVDVRVETASENRVQGSAFKE